MFSLLFFLGFDFPLNRSIQHKLLLILITSKCRVLRRQSVPVDVDRWRQGMICLRDFNRYCSRFSLTEVLLNWPLKSLFHLIDVSTVKLKVSVLLFFNIFSQRHKTKIIFSLIVRSTCVFCHLASAFGEPL